MIFYFLFFLFMQIPTIVNADISWNHSSGNYESHRYSKLKQINKKNIRKLNKTWIFNSGKIDKKNVVQATPIYVDNKLITVDIYGGVSALNPVNGVRLWFTQLKSPVGRRGMTSLNGENPKIYITTKNNVVELNASDGSILKEFNTGLSLLPPIIDKNKIFVATLKNGVKAYDLKTKNLLWEFSLKKNNVNPRIWSGFSFDPVTKNLYIVTSNPGGLYGADRVKDDLSVSLIALNSKTGLKQWHFQHIRHDLWDFDLVGNPIIFSTKKDNQIIRVVVALSKTGDLIYLNANDGSFIFPNSIKKITVPKSNVSKEQTGSFQYQFIKPKPFSDIEVDLKNEFKHLDKTTNKKLFNILSNSKSGRYIPPSFNHDIILFGLHGGAEWPGGSYNEKDNSIIIPYNREPWVIRMEYKDKIFKILTNVSKELNKAKIFINQGYDKITNYFGINHNKYVEQKNEYKSAIINPWEKVENYDSISKALFSLVPYGGSNEFYINNCSSCHGIGRQGHYENELVGDKYVPSLVGINFKNNNKNYNSFKKIKEYHNNVDINFDFDENFVLETLKNFNEYDNLLKDINFLEINGFWQILLDDNGYPASKPPWGGIAKINMDNGDLEWKIPFGKRYDINKRIISIGDKNFGGVMTTKSGIFFATGTPDEMARAFSTNDGRLLWERKLPYAGSAPPMSYYHYGCQYIVFTSTGGQFVGFKDKGDSTVAYKLEDCNN